MYSGVNPFCDCAFTEAPRCTSNCTTSSCPAKRKISCELVVPSKKADEVRERRARGSREMNVYLKIARSRGLVLHTFNEKRGTSGQHEGTA